jgi:glucokinase
VYLAGAIAPRIVGRLSGPRFLEAFRRKGRVTALLSDVPIRVVTHPHVGVIGAAAAAMQGARA